MGRRVVARTPSAVAPATTVEVVAIGPALCGRKSGNGLLEAAVGCGRGAEFDKPVASDGGTGVEDAEGSGGEGAGEAAITGTGAARLVVAGDGERESRCACGGLSEPAGEGVEEGGDA